MAKYGWLKWLGWFVLSGAACLLSAFFVFDSTPDNGLPLILRFIAPCLYGTLIIWAACLHRNRQLREAYSILIIGNLALVIAMISVWIGVRLAFNASSFAIWTVTSAGYLTVVYRLLRSVVHGRKNATRSGLALFFIALFFTMVSMPIVTYVARKNSPMVQIPN
jgi:FtsH-binding integral membrane protein